MSIASEIERIKTNIANAYAKCEEKGAILPTILNSANLVDCIASITGGEPVTPPSGGYITDGLVALFSGEDKYVNDTWVDRINGYTFSSLGSGAKIPVYDAINKLDQQKEKGGLKSNFILPAGSNYTFEVVTRDAKNATSSTMSNYYATIVGCQMENWRQTEGGVHLYRLPTSDDKFQFGESKNGLGYIPRDEFVDGALDTFTQIPGQALYRNGEKIMDIGENPADRYVGLFSHYEGSNANYYRGMGKIHAVRVYGRQLTAEEVAHNHEEDIRIYGA
jgi:hypothetical protein